MGGATTTLTHNGFGELTGQTATFGGDTLYQAAYTRDNGGRITGLTETARGVTTTWDYDYSASGRLFRVVRDSADTTVYSYDANGNRIQVVSPLGTVTGTYDGEDRLQTYGGADYTYNNAGQLTQKDAGGQVTSYTYDVLGNLTAVTLPDSTQISYLVDGQGRRIGKKVNGVLVQGWLWQGQLAPVAELDGSGQVVSRFVYGTRVNVPDYMERGGETYRLVTNHLGSVELVVNASTGQVVSWRDYDEWGRVVADSNPDFQPFGFAGGLHDGGTGLVRFGARDFQPELGRWSTKDPAGIEGGDPNLYDYAFGDPVDLADATGKFVPPWVVTGLIGATYAGVQAYRSGAGASDVFTAAFGGFVGGLIPGAGFARFVRNTFVQELLGGATSAFIGNLVGQAYSPQTGCPMSIELRLGPALLAALNGALGTLASTALPFGAAETLPGSAVRPLLSGLLDFFTQPDAPTPGLEPLPVQWHGPRQ